MRQTNFALALLAAAVLSACGGSDNNNSTTTPPAKPVFASQVSFGDSLSDLGTYKVGTVAAVGGGTYTINGDNTATNAALHGKNWTQLMATQMGFTAAVGKAPCPAQTGLDGVAAQGFAVPVTQFPLCTSYAMGGARVTNPVGPGNKLTGAAIGQLTYPVVAQVALHLSRNGGKFAGNEIVYVWAGGNDLLMLLGQLTAAATAAGNAEGAKVGASTFVSSLSTKLTVNATTPATAKAAVAAAMATEAARAGSTSASLVGVAVQTAATQPGNAAVASPAVYGPLVAAAQTEAGAAGTAAGTAAANAYAAANGPALVPQMSDAGLQLGALIRNEIVGKGATHVVVNSLPDVANATPTGMAQSASGKQLIAGMVSAFNLGLQVGIDGLSSSVLYVDLFAQSQAQLANPTAFGISNATTPACAARAPFGTTSLFCVLASTTPGVDVSKFIFADDVHPAPYGQTLIAKKVAEDMVAKGWL